MKLKFIIAIVLSILSLDVKSQAFIGTGGSIPDNQTPVYFPLTISGLPNTALDSTFGIEGVCIDITHTYDADLRIWLITPDSTFIELSTDNGGSDDNYTSTCFSDLASNLISTGSAPFTGTYKPESPLFAAHNGQNPNGNWYLYILDTYPVDSGTLNSWTISFGSNIGQPFSFPSSNLPIVKINTLGQVIPDEPKITARMQIIDNGAGIRNYVNDTIYTYEGSIGIEIRGSSSQMFPKKSFAVETRDSLGNDLDVSLLGMPAESDWILNANYTDKTFLRNALSYHIANEMGNYASRTRYCEVFINGMYQGLYVFMEKIKRNANRVDISKLTENDTIGNDVTGGYILKVDKTTGSGSGGFLSNFPPYSGGQTPFILYDYPDDVTIKPQQGSYIQSFMDSFETVLNSPLYTDPIIGYKKYINDSSFIDFFIANEISKNVDGYRISSYLHKKKITKGNLLYAGPIWDYDIAWGNADYYNGQFTTGWSYLFSNTGDGYQVPFWWQRLLTDPSYADKLSCRYNQLRSSVLATVNLENYIDSMAIYLQESQDRNFQIWPILGTYVWPNPSPFASNYAGEITNLKNWISNRLIYLDNFMPGNCSVASLNSEMSESRLTIFPNPTTDILTISLIDLPIENVSVINVNGKTVIHDSSMKRNQFSLNVKELPAGVYYINVKSSKGSFNRKFVKL